MRKKLYPLIRFTEPSPFELYLPPSPSPLPLICITPILGRLAFMEDLILERWSSRFFSSQGFAVALMDRPIFEFDPSRGLEQIQEYLDDSLGRSKSVLDLLTQRPEIDSTRIGSYGMSFGAVVNFLWAASDPRVKAHVFSLAGGNIPEIIMTSRDPLMRSYYKAIVNRRSGRPLEPAFQESLKTALRQAIQSDPLKVAHLIPRENVLMSLAVFDHVIYFRYGLELWRALGKPETVFFPLGHYTAILTIPFMKWKILGFFKKKLGPVPS